MVNDILGNEIKLGDMVMYPSGDGRITTWMNYGRVMAYIPGKLNPLSTRYNPKFDLDIKAFHWKWHTPPILKVRVREKCKSGDPEGKVINVSRVDRVVVVPHQQFNEADREFFELESSKCI